jgi:hypothetical protein
MRDEQGLKYREIAALVGRSISTVQEAYQDPTGARSRVRKTRLGRPCADCGTWVSNSGSPVREGARCRACDSRALRTDLSVRARLGTHLRPCSPKWTDEAVFRALRGVARDGVVSTNDYKDAYAEAPRGTMPSLARIIQRFEFWAAAVEAAGLRTAGGARGRYSCAIPTVGLLAALEDCWAEMGRPPTYEEFNGWAQRHDVPSGQTIRNRTGTWMAALEMCAPSMDSIPNTTEGPDDRR